MKFTPALFTLAELVCDDPWSPSMLPSDVLQWSHDDSSQDSVPRCFSAISYSDPTMIPLKIQNEIQIEVLRVPRWSSSGNNPFVPHQATRSTWFKTIELFVNPTMMFLWFWMKSSGLIILIWCFHSIHLLTRDATGLIKIKNLKIIKNLKPFSRLTRLSRRGPQIVYCYEPDDSLLQVERWFVGSVGQLTTT